MSSTETIPARRVAGFLVLVLAILVGTITFAFVMQSCQAAPPPETAASEPPTAPSGAGATERASPLPTLLSPAATPAPSIAPAATATRPPMVRPPTPASSGPIVGHSNRPFVPTIPPFVPIPSGPVP